MGPSVQVFVPWVPSGPRHREEEPGKHGQRDREATTVRSEPGETGKSGTSPGSSPSATSWSTAMRRSTTRLVWESAAARSRRSRCPTSPRPGPIFGAYAELAQDVATGSGGAGDGGDVAVEGDRGCRCRCRCRRGSRPSGASARASRMEGKSMSGARSSDKGDSC